MRTPAGKTVQNGTAPCPGEGRGGLLDALRFLAALLIVLYHFGGDAPVALEGLHPVFARGYLATDFFLILSGYVLGRAYGAQVLSGRTHTPGFVIKRLARIWPGQLAVLAGFVLVVAGAAAVGVAALHPEHYRLADLAREAFLVQAWGIAGERGWNAPSWSLSALLLCYAAFPLAWRAMSRLTGIAPLLVGVLAVMAADVLSRAVFGHTVYDLDFHLGAVRAAPFFILGLGIARMVEQGLPAEGRARELLWVAGLWLAGLQVMGRLDLGSILAIAAAVLACGRLPVRQPSALVERAARLSFALFITHALTGLVWFGVVNRLELTGPAQWLAWAAAFPAALALAWAFDRYFDAPVQAWLAPRLRLRPAPRPAPAPSG